jgi:5-methyltetrahydrofolate--homocysteine methyltransferase
MRTVLRGRSQEVAIAAGSTFVIIGEKINPTGNKKLAAALKSGQLDSAVDLAVRQVAWGADVLDINVGVPGLDEVQTIDRIVRMVAEAVDVPLCIDSGDPRVLEAGLAAAPGKPLVNSVNAEEKQLEAILPIVNNRGAAVIGLTLDEGGIPKTAEERVAAAEKILNRSIQEGIAEEDVIIDPLVLTIGSDSNAARITLETVGLLRERLGLNINLGASNVSFGLPDRPSLNQAFLAMAIQSGATCSITDPVKLGATIRASDALLGRDLFATRFIKHYRTTENLRQKEAGATTS